MMKLSKSKGAVRRSPYAPFAAFVVSIALAGGLTLPMEGHADTAEPSGSEIRATLDAKALDRLGPVQDEAPASAVARHVVRTEEQIVSMTRDAKIDAFVSEAMAHNGARYVYGGTSPSGFDCSGFVLYSMRESLGIELPRTAAAQSTLGERVPMDELQKGDLLFWGSGRGVYHVGIYLEDSTYIHAAGTGKGVRVQSFDYHAPTFAKRLI